MPGGIRIIQKGNERIRVSGSLEHPWNTRMDDIQVLQGTFWCGTGCLFTREIYAQGDAFVGAGTRLQAIAADGNLTLAPGVRVARWVDCAGEMEIGADSIIGSRATAKKSIHMHKGAQVASAFAPIVTTARRPNPGSQTVPELAPPTLEITPPGEVFRDLGKLKIDPRKLSPLGADCWLHNGDLKPSVPIRLKSKLVIKGDFFIPDGSILEQDVKAHGRILVGVGALCMGSVIAGRDILFGPVSRFRDVVHAGRELRLGSGVCGGEPGAPVSAFAAERLSLDDNVAVYGKVASAGSVFVLPDHTGRKK
jgi:hypothetical protein